MTKLFPVICFHCGKVWINPDFIVHVDEQPFTNDEGMGYHAILSMVDKQRFFISEDDWYAILTNQLANDPTPII